MPFCPYVCPYCDFAKWPLRRSAAAAYLRALEAEIERAPAFAARTLFYGGGTPNAYGPADLAALTDRLRDRFALPADAEVSIECNPDPGLCTAEAFEAYAAAGIGRVSFGVQSFAGPELAALGRRHTAADVARAVGLARAAGIRDVSIDLMFGTPGQTLASWGRSLEAALALAPDHVSTYGLTIEESTPYASWYARAPEDFADGDLEADMYALAIERLGAAGFEHYEVSNFARPGRRCAHNEGYWRNGDYLGLGVGAASYLGGERSVHVRELDAYVAAAAGGGPIPAESERLEGAAMYGEAAMLALRTLEGVDRAAYARRYGIDFASYYAPVLAEMADAGTLDVTPTHVRLTRRGRFVANDVCGAFVTFAGP